METKKKEANKKTKKYTKYNRTQCVISLNPNLVDEFKKKCSEDFINHLDMLELFMDKFIQGEIEFIFTQNGNDLIISKKGDKTDD